MTTVEVLSVFTAAGGEFGNPLGVVRDGAAIEPSARQELAAELGFSETVFIEDAEERCLRLHTPVVELPFAGHAVVGAAWLLDGGRKLLRVLQTPAGEIEVEFRDELVWIRAHPTWCPPWQHVRTSSAEDVSNATGPPTGHDAVQIWAFEDEQAGLIRARVFADRFGVPEDEACGSASVLLCAQLGRPLTIHHGRGSEIFVAPGREGTIRLGGRVTRRDTRHITGPREEAA